jgi:hypothetical protein
VLPCPQNFLSRCVDKFDGTPRVRYSGCAGWSSLVARRAHNPKVVSSNLTPATNYLNPRPGIRRPAFSFVAGSSSKSRAVIFLCAPQTTRDAGRRSSSSSNLPTATNFMFVYKGFLNSSRKPFLFVGKLRAKNSGLLCSKLLRASLRYERHPQFGSGCKRPSLYRPLCCGPAYGA